MNELDLILLESFIAYAAAGGIALTGWALKIFATDFFAVSL